MISQCATPRSAAAAEDETVGGHVDSGALRQRRDVRSRTTAREERLPAAPPVHSRRRPIDPHRVAIGDAEHGEERGEGVADERRVEVREVARADDDGGGEQQRPERRPRAGAHAIDRLSRRAAAGARARRHRPGERRAGWRRAARAPSTTAARSPATARRTSRERRRAAAAGRSRRGRRARRPGR